MTVPGAVKGWEMMRARFGTLPTGLGTLVDLLVDGASGGWSDEQLRSLLGRMVPDFRVDDVEYEVDVEVAGA